MSNPYGFHQGMFGQLHSQGNQVSGQNVFNQFTPQGHHPFNFVMNRHTTVMVVEIIRYTAYPFYDGVFATNIPVHSFISGTGRLVLKSIGVALESELPSANVGSKSLHVNIPPLGSSGTIEIDYEVSLGHTRTATIVVESISTHNLAVYSNKPGVVVHGVYETVVTVPGWARTAPVELTPSTVSIKDINAVISDNYAEVLFPTAKDPYKVPTPQESGEELEKTQKNLLEGFELRNDLDEFIASIHDPEDTVITRRTKQAIVSNTYHELVSTGTLTLDHFKRVVRGKLENVFTTATGPGDGLDDEYLDAALDFPSISRTNDKLTDRELGLKALEGLAELREIINTLR